MTYKDKKRLVRLRKGKRIALAILLVITLPISFLLIAVWIIANSTDSRTQYGATHWNDNNLMY